MVSSTRARHLTIAVAILAGIAAAVAPHLISRVSPPRDEPITIGPAVGMPGAPPTSSEGLRQRITEMEDRIRREPRVMGDALIELGEYDKAFEAFDTMVTMRPSAAAYARVAYARELRGNPAGALQAMQMAQQATPVQDPEAQAWYAAQIGELDLKLEKFDDAIREYRRAAFVFPNYPQ